MIGIYRIVNKLSGKSYIGQSIHCGKRFDEHTKGKQLIDQIIQIEGVENFTFELLKECDTSELSYWEDYYIIKYNTMYPNGYNKRWNCSEEIRKEMRGEIESGIENKTENGIKSKAEKLTPKENVYELLKTNSLKLWVYLLQLSYESENNTYNLFLETTKKDIAKKLDITPTTLRKYWNKLENDGNLVKLNFDKQYQIKTNILITKEMAENIDLNLSELEVKIYILLKNLTKHKKNFSANEIKNFLGYSRDDLINSIRVGIENLKSKNLLNYRIEHKLYFGIETNVYCFD